MQFLVNSHNHARQQIGWRVFVSLTFCSFILAIHQGHSRGLFRERSRQSRYNGGSFFLHVSCSGSSVECRITHLRHRVVSFSKNLDASTAPGRWERFLETGLTINWFHYMSGNVTYHETSVHLVATGTLIVSTTSVLLCEM